MLKNRQSKKRPYIFGLLLTSKREVIVYYFIRKYAKMSIKKMSQIAIAL